jgi:hypothetical protein
MPEHEIRALPSRPRCPPLGLLTRRPAPVQDTTWELARLRVQVTALAAENDQLRSNAQGLAQQLCEVKTAARQQLRDATLQCRQTEQAAALRTACVEEQSERQRRVLVRGE